MGLRRLLVVVVVLAACVACVPPAWAHGTASSDTVTGTLRSWHGDTFTTPVGAGTGVDTTVAGVVPLVSPPANLGRLLGRQVRASGERQGVTLKVGATGEVAAADGSGGGSGAPVAAATGTKSVAVLLFNFANDTRQPWTTSAVRGVVFDNADSVREYYLDASYGQLSMTGDVFGWFTIDSTNAGCNYTSWANEARAKATAAGVPLSNYQYTVYAFPQISGCGWAGLAYLPGTTSWINGSMTLRVVGHELGHNFGVHHASTLSCSSGALSGSCSASEYGDPVTIMGAASRRHHNNWHRAQLGWFSDTVTASSSGVHRLAPAELSGTPRLLRIPRGNGTYLNLEYRRPWGIFDDFTSSDPVVNGVSIRVGPELSSLVQSLLIDATPGSPGGFSDAALPAGSSLTDPLSGVTITVISVSAAYADVSVQYPGSTGLLRVTTSPAVPSQISVDGVPMDSWGLNWVKLAPGQHTVSFSEVDGYAAPADQAVTVTAGATTTVTGAFSARALLRVLTSPALPGTITVDGIPRNDWGLWTWLPAGSHQVCFGAVSDFAAPACQNLQLSAGAQSTVTGAYSSDPGAAGASDVGYLRVTTSPALPAQVSVAGAPAATWGLDWLKLSPGQHTVSFADVDGYTTPADQTVTVSAGATTTVTGAYAQRGLLRVVTSPAVPGTITVDGTPRNDWGLWTWLPTGSHTVCFGAVSGYTTPSCQTVTLSAGVQTSVTGAYS
jgi:hypothetical protein